MDRASRRFLSVAIAVGCLVVAAFLGIDWADYGEDSTCGNFIRRKNWSGPCSDIMWHRTFAVVGLVLFAILVLVIGWRRDGRASAPQPHS